MTWGCAAFLFENETGKDMSQTNLLRVSMTQHEVGSFDVCMNKFILVHILQYIQLKENNRMAWLNRNLSRPVHQLHFHVSQTMVLKMWPLESVNNSLGGYKIISNKLCCLLLYRQKLQYDVRFVPQLQAPKRKIGAQ